ncbi:MAG: LytTR family DNA-binding domain-containing protein [Thermoanaerobacteraceae bacterium]|nr:LytTR family DNA-binding domain-containing protein [Thermoanaerobacteraceae bacterium]
MLLVDDEKPARDELRFLLKERDVEVIGEAASYNEAIKKIGELKPDVVFLDIELGGKSGMDIAARIRRSQYPPYIVFVTAYDRYAVSAFEVQAEDYILKPFSSERLDITLRRIQQKLQVYHTDKITVQKDGRFYLINIRDVYYIYADGRENIVKTIDGEYEVSATLKELAQRFHNQLLRTHKAYLVNIDRIKEIIPWFDGTYMLHLKDISDEIPVSRSYVKEMKARFYM